jgi:hypothetical protein
VSRQQRNNQATDGKVGYVLCRTWHTANIRQHSIRNSQEALINTSRNGGGNSRPSDRPAANRDDRIRPNTAPPRSGRYLRPHGPAATSFSASDATFHIPFNTTSWAISQTHPAACRIRLRLSGRGVPNNQFSRYDSKQTLIMKAKVEPTSSRQRSRSKYAAHRSQLNKAMSHPREHNQEK